ncbi:hypothetical protein GCM10009304_28750 [Pseudomonas matsuisoli]|uniref:Uncharacterized protein n=1 Tax=Pseudomonas matsuisoli TaxID=1515666 RepID=A0A917PZ57_9PSED|nr:hypothetical protein GCM10009304_28750 [Pseudomonas matsuisoli]
MFPAPTPCPAITFHANTPVKPRLRAYSNLPDIQGTNGPRWRMQCRKGNRRLAASCGSTYA